MTIIYINKKLILIILLSFSSLFLIGCTLNKALNNSLDSPRECNAKPAKILNTYVFDKPETKFVYILVDKSSHYFSNSNKVLDFIKKSILGKDTITEYFKPGDRIIIAWLDNQATTKSIFFNEEVEIIEPPKFRPTPTPLPENTPLPTVEGPTTLEGLYKQTLIAQENKNLVVQENHYCDIGEWNLDSDKLYHDWEIKQHNAILEISKNALDNILPLTEANTEQNKKVYESLKLSSQILKDPMVGNNYKNRILLIFSDLEDKNNDSIIDQSLNIDLKGINTFVITPQCEFSIDCTAKYLWENQLASFGGINTLFAGHFKKEFLNPTVVCITNPARHINNYEFNNKNKKYIFVLIDKSKEYYEYSNEAINLTKNQIVDNLLSGDRLIIAWMGLNKTSTSIFFDLQMPSILPPQFPPTPTSPIESQTESIDSQVVQEQYYCEIGKWNSICDAIYKEWYDSQEKTLENTKYQAKSTIIPFIEEDAEPGKLIYENLQLASRMFGIDRDKRQYKKYILIIFSDMIHWHLNKPSDISIDLEGVDTLIISQECNFEIDCPVKSAWEDQLYKYGVNNLSFITRENNLPTFLNNYLSLNR